MCIRLFLVQIANIVCIAENLNRVWWEKHQTIHFDYKFPILISFKLKPLGENMALICENFSENMEPDLDLSHQPISRITTVFVSITTFGVVMTLSR